MAGYRFQVLTRPVYTGGSVTYVADIDNKPILPFPESWSMAMERSLICIASQDSLRVSMATMVMLQVGQLVSSLQLMRGPEAGFLIPSRGPVINNPDSAIQKTVHRIHSL